MSKARSKAALDHEPAKAGYPSKVSRADILFIIAIVLLAFTIRYVSIADNGITSDEPIYTLFGIDYIDNLVHLNINAQDWAKNIEHPPVSKYIYGAVAYLFTGPVHTPDAFTVTKLASALMGVLTCVLVYLIGRDFFDRKTGFAAAVILALLPTFVAHTQIAALESPLALFCTLTIYLYMLALKNGSRKLFLASAVAFGLVISTKYNGLLLLPVLGLFFLVYRLSDLKARHGRIDQGLLKENLKILVPVESAITFMGLAVLLFFALWPFLWTGPVVHLLQSLNHWTYDISEYFLGSRVAPPLYYYPVYFSVTLPALLFLPLALGVWDVIRSRDPFKIGVLLWFIVPFAYGLSSFVQDGIRYIFIIYPAVALLCALGLVQAAGLIGRLGQKVAGMTADRAFWALTALATAYLVLTAASVYPYYLDYYNEFTGGPANVQEHRLFKTGWWGEGMKECMDWIGETAPPGASVVLLTLPEDPTNSPFTHDQRYIYPWLSKTNGTNMAYTFSKEPLNVTLDTGEHLSVVPDYVLINQKMQEDYNVTLDDPAYTLVYQATVQGAPLAQVYRKTGA